MSVMEEGESWFPNPLKPKKKSEKSQEELRVVLKEKFELQEPILKKSLAEYQESLKNGNFENRDGEEAGSGEKRKEVFQKRINDLLDRAEKMKERLDSGENLPQFQEDLSATYTHPDGRQETITLSFEQKLQEFLDLYQGTGIDLPSNFENTARDIWERNHSEMEKAIQEKGFDEILIIPGNIPLPDLAEKMKMENGYYEGDNFKNGGGFTGAKSQNADRPRIILVHKTQNLKDRPELQQTLNIKGQDVNQNEALSLEDYLVFKNKYFRENQKHLDEIGATWLATKSGARLVNSGWAPVVRLLDVAADDLGDSAGDLGVRPSRCFF